MYVPSAFAKTDLAVLHDFIESNSFGLLVSSLDEPPTADDRSSTDNGQRTTDVPFASHLPFLLDRDAGRKGALIGHMARANSQWQSAADQTVLAVFSGPHAYISPTWYEAEQVVPTWNYVAVHAYGKLRVIDERNALLDLLQQTVRLYEQNQPQPWSFDAGSTFIERLLAQIVGFHIEIEKIEGKWKLNQNHPIERRERVIQALRQQDGENAQAIAALMRATME